MQISRAIAEIQQIGATGAKFHEQVEAVRRAVLIHGCRRVDEVVEVTRLSRWAVDNALKLLLAEKVVETRDAFRLDDEAEEPGRPVTEYHPKDTRGAKTLLTSCTAPWTMTSFETRPQNKRLPVAYSLAVGKEREAGRSHRMLILLFQSAGEAPSQPWAMALGVLAVILGAINVYQLYKSREAGTWKGAANAYEAELGIVRTRAERLTIENQDLTREVTELKSRTDLSKLAHDSSEQHAGIVLALKDLSETSARHHAQLTQTMSEQTKLFLGLQSHTASVFEHVAEQFRTIKADLDRR